MIFRWQPKQTKFKRLQKGDLKKCRYKMTARGAQKGICGLRILKSTRLTVKQLEQARRKILTVRKKREKQTIWTRCQPDIPVTTKPLGIRMGKGKGTVEYWISRATAGKLIFVLSPRPIGRARAALRKAQKILPIPTKLYINRNLVKRRIRFSLMYNT